MRRSHAYWILIGLLIIQAGGGILFLRGVEPPPSYDPAYHFTIALDCHDFFNGLGERPWHGVITGYQDVSAYYPPVFHTLVGLVFLFTGPSVTAARGVTFALFLILIYVTYLVGARYRNRRTGLLAAFLISTYPICVGYSRLVYLDLPLLVMVMVSLLVLDWAGNFGSLRRCVLLGVTLGLGILTKWFYLVFFSGPMLWALAKHLIPVSWSDILRWGRRDWAKTTERCLVWGIFPAVVAGFIVYLLGATPPLAAAVACVYLAGAAILTVVHIAVSANTVDVPPGALLLRWRNALIAFFVALLIALPWYSRHHEHISEIAEFSIIKAADPEGGMIGRVKESGWLYYVVRLESFQLHFVYFVVFLLSLSSFRSRRLLPTVLPLGFGFIIGVLFLSSLPLQYPRYGIPYLAYVALLSAIWVDRLGGRFRRAVILVLVLNGIVVYSARTFPFPPRQTPPRELALKTDRGDFIVYSERGAGNATDFAHDWSVKEITARMVERTRETGYRTGAFPQVIVLANDSFFHFHAFTAYARLMDSPLEAATFRYENPSHRVHEKFLHAQFVIEKTGNLGPDFTLGEIHEALETVKRYDLLAPDLFRMLGSWNLPDGTKGRLYENMLWVDTGQFTLPGEEPGVVFENGFRLEMVRVRPIAAAGRHALVVWTAWTGPERDPPGVDFFVHVRPADGTLVGSSGRSLVDECWIDGSQRQRRQRRFLLFFPKPIPDAEVRLSLGMWKPETNERLECRDSNGKRLPEDTYCLSKPLRFPPIPIQSINENR